MTNSTTFSAETIPNRFDFSSAQSRLYAMWEQQGCFHAEPDPAREPFCIVIPPPNVTGALHLGHALNNTLQDVLIRFRRMQGFCTLWMPGTDHAGIATQAVVERRLLEEEGKSRHELGREALVERIWTWKDQYEARIISQLKQMGCSCDWERTRFTLDPICARAVRHTFFSLFREQLIYRGKRLVNWDTFLQTAVSDDEVFHDEVDGHFWHFQYPVVDPQPGEPTHVSIATTRPETMLGDTAVAVHPDPETALAQAAAELTQKLASASLKDQPEIAAQRDEVQHRREHLLPHLIMLRDMARDGRMIRLPLLDRPIPLIADEWAKPELGSGCVKITPAHDPNDHEVWQRHPDIGAINILNPDGTLNTNAGPYQGLSISAARKRVVHDLDQLDLLEKVEDRKIDLAHSDRSKTPIEPYLADQWFVRMPELAQTAMDAVSDGRVRIVPTRYAKGYIDWLREKRDWPVSRQLWWGHRIPIWSRRFEEARPLRAALAALQADPAAARGEIAWQTDPVDEAGPDAEVPAILQVCIRDEDAEIESRIQALGLVQDPDVLDTWFSSALWPHSTLGWPDRTPELAYFYPTSVLITSRDIITLWVARMVLTGLHNMGEIPFRDVFIHPKILDGYGETMSKSKGNGVDPIDVIEKFGADALRFGLAYLTTETQDVRLPVEFECPHCAALIEQTKENRVRPSVQCTKCRKKFSTQWAAQPADTALPRGPVVSERFELARNFGNKLWNASRFALINLEEYTPTPIDDVQLLTEDRWILSRLSTVTAQVTAHLEAFRFADAARTLYDFAWDEFCSFYIEMAKGRLTDPAARGLAQGIVAHTLDTLLRLLHPMMPFITEEVWQLLGRIAPCRGIPLPRPAPATLMRAAWPEACPAHQDRQIERRFNRFQATLSALREIRSRQGIAPRQLIDFSVRCDAEAAQLLSPMEAYFESMAQAHNIGWGPQVQAPGTCATVSTEGMDVYVDLKDLIDVDAEIQRNEKQLAKLNGMIAGKEKKLSNRNFVEKAPADVVQRERDGLSELQSQRQTVAAALAELRKSE